MTQENTTIENQPIDYYAVFKGTIVFEDAELNEELNRQVAIEKELSSAEGSVFEESLKNELTQLKAKKAVMETALLLSGALSIESEEDFGRFTEKLIQETEADDKTALKIRANLLLEEPSETRAAIREMLEEQNKDDAKALRQARIKFDMRVDSFVDQFRKKYSI